MRRRYANKNVFDVVACTSVKLLSLQNQIKVKRYFFQRPVDRFVLVLVRSTPAREVVV